MGGIPTAPENADSPAGLVPLAEILVSPVLSYQLGKLGRDGQRVLRLGWQVWQHPPGILLGVPPPFHPLSRPLSLPQQAPKEQGDVTYTLRIRMLACHCTELAEEDAVVLGREVTVHNLTLSGAEYEILLTAANAAGTGPARQLHVPAEQRAGTCPVEGLSSLAASRELCSQPSLAPPVSFQISASRTSAWPAAP